MLEGFSLGSYLLLVDFTGRLFRDGKAVISAELAGILERLGSSAESWRARLEKLKDRPPARPILRRQSQRLREVAAAWAFTTSQTSTDARQDKEFALSGAAASLKFFDRCLPGRIYDRELASFPTLFRGGSVQWV